MISKIAFKTINLNDYKTADTTSTKTNIGNSQVTQSTNLNSPNAYYAKQNISFRGTEIRSFFPSKEEQESLLVDANRMMSRVKEIQEEYLTALPKYIEKYKIKDDDKTAVALRLHSGIATIITKDGKIDYCDFTDMKIKDGDNEIKLNYEYDSMKNTNKIECKLPGLNFIDYVFDENNNLTSVADTMYVPEFNVANRQTYNFQNGKFINATID